MIKRFVLFIIPVLILFCCIDKKETGQLILKDVWKLEQAQINSFDPLDAYHAYHIQLVKQLFNTLTDLDSMGKIVPSLAVSWETKNGKNWIFHLREDVLFIPDSCFSSDKERKLNANDVKYTFERLLAPDSKSFGISYFTNIKGVNEYRNEKSQSIIGIEVLDKNTIIFNLINTDYNFPNLLSLPYCSIVKEKAVKTSDPKQYPIGTGPFILENYMSNQSISLVKNKDYWEKSGKSSLPIIDKVEIALTTDDNYTFLLFKNQKTDFLELNIPLLKQMENSSFLFAYKKDIFESAQLNFYLFNLEKIKDSGIRKGISSAINKTKMQDLLGNNGTVTQSLYPKMFEDLSGSKKILEYDPTKAKELLVNPMNLKLVVFDDILSRSLANQFMEDLKPYSVKIEIEAVPFSVLVDRLVSGKYDMIQLYWGMLYADVSHFLVPFKTSSFPPAGNNFNKYSNPEFDNLVNEAMQNSTEQQKDIYIRAENIILEDMPFILAFYKNTIRVSNQKFKLPINPLLYKFYKNAVPIE